MVAGVSGAGDAEGVAEPDHSEVQAVPEHRNEECALKATGKCKSRPQEISPHTQQDI